LQYSWTLIKSYYGKIWGNIR